MKKYKNIIWDWNGTLLNDMEICINAMSPLLKERNLPPLTDDKYREVFTFPVRDYYEQIGFNFLTEKFEVPALQFIDNYKRMLPNANLFYEAEDVLQQLHNKKLNQYILSAMEHESLKTSVKSFGIDKYFTEIVGINNHFAHSKIDIGIKLIKLREIDRQKTLMIGDTLHDKEVAETLGIDCILVSQGHQKADRLKINGNRVIKSLNELIDFL